MAVTVNKPNAKTNEHPSGKYMQVMEGGHLVIRSEYDGAEATNPVVAIYAPGQWRSATVDAPEA